ncbi:MAG: sugar phosphate nucleotidyltransferase, partial [Candidatus Nanohaloarchaea archaeon]
MQAVLLAGGASSRFWPLNTRHKSLLQIQGKPLIRHTLDGLADAGVDDAVIVQGPERDIEQELDAPDSITTEFVVQEEARGMGNALRKAEEHVDGAFLVTGPYRTGAGDLLAALQRAADGSDAAVAAAETASPEQYGVLDIDGDRVTGIVEKPTAAAAPSRYRAVSTYLLTDAVFDALDAVEEHEYSFEDALDRYMDTHDVGVARLDAREVLDDEVDLLV